MADVSLEESLRDASFSTGAGLGASFGDVCFGVGVDLEVSLGDCVEVSLVASFAVLDLVLLLLTAAEVCLPVAGFV